MAPHMRNSTRWKLYSERNRRPFRRGHTEPNSILLRDCVQGCRGTWNLMWWPKSLLLCHHAFDGVPRFGSRELSMFLQVASNFLEFLNPIRCGQWDISGFKWHLPLNLNAVRGVYVSIPMIPYKSVPFSCLRTIFHCHWDSRPSP